MLIHVRMLDKTAQAQVTPITRAVAESLPLTITQLLLTSASAMITTHEPHSALLLVFWASIFVRVG